MPDSEKPRKKFFTPEMIAKSAGCVVQTIYRQINEEDSPFPGARRIGKRKWIIPEEDVLEYFGFDPSEEKVTIVRS